MNNNTKIQERVKENTNEEINNKTEVTPPENYDVMLYNDNTVHFFAVRDVLEAVLQIGAARAWAIVMHAHTFGKASVFTGPEDVAYQYRDALLADAQARMGEPDANFKGYGRMRFDVEKVKK